MLKTTPKPRGRSTRCTAAVTPTRASGSTAITEARTDAEVPEWMTELWKHRVDGEARYRLNRTIRGVGAAR